ncbi:hypothetical protein NC653_028655 [Populus alba x Populus x berolinensis]|uniref:Uncharacterized protein n=1 Tax=Populus alba x Populus x berolinensis TaxID=444605 RepID=A0AAD6Q2H9_9ROSI|nr:hypothetical protein NC653_028655 [Populus alba x Populus x berolinensis]
MSICVNYLREILVGKKITLRTVLSHEFKNSRKTLFLTIGLEIYNGFLTTIGQGKSCSSIGDFGHARDPKALNAQPKWLVEAHKFIKLARKVLYKNGVQRMRFHSQALQMIFSQGNMLMSIDWLKSIDLSEMKLFSSLWDF